MAFTKVVGAGIHTLSNITSHNINSSGIITATKFVGPFDGGGGINAGIVTCTTLDVNGNGDVSGNFVIDGNLTVNGTTSTIDTNLIGVDRVEVGANSNSIVGVAITQSGTADILNLFDGGTKVVTVDDEGNVGLASAIPSKKLDVVGDTLIQGQLTVARSTHPQLIIKDSDTNSPGDENGISFRSANNTQYGFIGQTSTGGHTMLITTTNTVNPIRLQVNSSTNLEIGYTGVYVDNVNFFVNGGYNAYLSGEVHIADSLIHQGDTNTKIRFPAADTISFETSGYERFRITSGGIFGFNTNNPDTNFRFDFAGSARFGTGSYGSRIQFSRSGLGDELVIGVDGYGNSIANEATIQSSINSPRPLVFATNNTERFRINSNGQLLVGTTTTPSNSNSKLRVHFDQNTSSGNAIELSHSTNGADKAGAALGLAIDNGGASTNAADLYFSTATNGSLVQRLRIKSDGKVGIGTDTPNGDLQIRAGQNASFRVLADPSTSGLFVGNYGSGDGYRSLSLLGSSVRLYTITAGALSGAQQRVHITPTGSVLLGHESSEHSDNYQLELSDTGSNSSISLTSIQDNIYASQLSFVKARGSSLGSRTIVQDGDMLGQFAFYGTDGTNRSLGCTINVKVDGTPGNNDMPTRIDFATSNDGSQTVSNRLRLRSSGRVEIPGSLSIGDNATHTFSAHSEGDDLVIGGSGWRGMTIYGEGGGGVIQFADNGNNRIGQILYNHGNDSMDFRVNGNVTRLQLDADGSSYNTSNSSGTTTHQFYNSNSGSGADTRVMIKTYANQGADPYIKFDSGGSNHVVGQLYAGTTNNKLVLGVGESPSGGVSGIHIAGDGNAQITNDLYMAKSSDPRLYAGTNVGFNIDGMALYLNRYVNATIAMARGGGPVEVSNTTNGNDAQLNVYKSSGNNTDKAILRVGYDSNNAYTISRQRNSSSIQVDSPQGGSIVHHTNTGDDTMLLTNRNSVHIAKLAPMVIQRPHIQSNASWGGSRPYTFVMRFSTGNFSGTYHVARMISQHDWGFADWEAKVLRDYYSPDTDDGARTRYTGYYSTHSETVVTYNMKNNGDSGPYASGRRLSLNSNLGPNGAHKIHQSANGGYYKDAYATDYYVSLGTYSGVTIEVTVNNPGGWLKDQATSVTTIYPASFGGQASQSDADSWSYGRGIWFNVRPGVLDTSWWGYNTNFGQQTLPTS